MKYIAFSLGILAAVTMGLSEKPDKRDNLSKVQIENIEALTDNEKTDCWCCGNKGECLIAPNLIIVGKLSDKPC